MYRWAFGLLSLLPVSLCPCEKNLSFMPKWMDGIDVHSSGITLCNIIFCFRQDVFLIGKKSENDKVQKHVEECIEWLNAYFRDVRSVTSIHMPDICCFTDIGRLLYSYQNIDVSTVFVFRDLLLIPIILYNEHILPFCYIIHLFCFTMKFDMRDLDQENMILAN